MPAGRESPLLQARAGDLDEDALVDREDGVEAGDDALALALEQPGQHGLAVVAVPVARLGRKPLHIRVHDAGEHVAVAAQQRVEARPHQLVVAHTHGPEYPVARAVEVARRQGAAWKASRMRSVACGVRPASRALRSGRMGSSPPARAEHTQAQPRRSGAPDPAQTPRAPALARLTSASPGGSARARKRGAHCSHFLGRSRGRGREPCRQWGHHAYRGTATPSDRPARRR